MLCILHRWSAPVSPVIQSYRRDTFMRMLEKCVNAGNEILARESIFSPFSMGNSMRLPKARWLHSTHVQFLYVRRIHRPWALRPTIRVSVLDPKFLWLSPSLQLGTEFDPHTRHYFLVYLCQCTEKWSGSDYRRTISVLMKQYLPQLKIAAFYHTK